MKNGLVKLDKKDTEDGGLAEGNSNCWMAVYSPKSSLLYVSRILAVRWRLKLALKSMLQPAESSRMHIVNEDVERRPKAYCGDELM